MAVLIIFPVIVQTVILLKNAVYWRTGENLTDPVVHNREKL